MITWCVHVTISSSHLTLIERYISPLYYSTDRLVFPIQIAHSRYSGLYQFTVSLDLLTELSHLYISQACALFTRSFVRRTVLWLLRSQVPLTSSSAENLWNLLICISWSWEPRVGNVSRPNTGILLLVAIVPDSYSHFWYSDSGFLRQMPRR
jgi:hypothetical protein